MSEAAAPATRPTDDLILPFFLPALGLNGRLVKLGRVADDILCRHDYPEPVARLLGETLALTAALAGSIKYDGIFTLQARGDGALSMLVADLTTEGHLRGYAGLDKRRFAALGEAAPRNPVPRYLGAGHLVFTVDQGAETQRYQGVVELTGATLAECTQHYFRQSEQIETVLHLAVGRAGGAWRAGALTVQRLPAAPRDGSNAWDIAAFDEERREDAWRRVAALTGTLADAELLDPALRPESLLYRLFHEDGVRAGAAKTLLDRCRCSRERAANALRMLDEAELARSAEDGIVTVTCQFCNRHEKFEAADLRGLGPGPAAA